MTDIAEPGIDVESRTCTGPEDVPARTPWPAVVTLLAGGGVLALVVWDGPSILRAVSVPVYIAVAPGLACARLIRIPDSLSRFVVGVALGLALGVLVAQGLHPSAPMVAAARALRPHLDRVAGRPDRAGPGRAGSPSEATDGGGMTDIALGVARSGPVQAAVLTLLVLALIARIVVQLTGRPARRKTLRILDLVAAPLLVAFVVVIVQRFRDLS